MSRDGSKMYATEGGTTTTGYIWASTDYGDTWSTLTTAGNRSWSSIACTYDGTKLIAGIGASSGVSRYVYTSIDSGATWTERPNITSKQWTGVAISSNDGSQMAAWTGTATSSVYTSSDGGATFVSRNASKNVIKAATVSWDGTTWSLTTCSTVAATSCDINSSSNNGSTFVARNWTLKAYQFLAGSSNGSVLVTGNTGGIDPTILSTNYGLSSTNSGSQTVRQRCAAVSADGSRMIVGGGDGSTNPGYLWESIDGGANWLSISAPGTRQWYKIAMSADGNYVIAINSGTGYIYVRS